MAYNAPLPTLSGAAWPQIAALGVQGLALKIAASNHYNLDVVARLSGGQKSVGEAYAAYVSLVELYLAGSPVEATDFAVRLANLATVFHVIASACDEINTLIDANPGTVKTSSAAGALHPVKKRVFP